MDLVAALTAIPGVGPYLPYIGVAITLATTILAVMPTPKSPTGWYARVFAVVHFVAALRTMRTPAT